MFRTVFLFSCGLEHGSLFGDTKVLVVHCLVRHFRKSEESCFLYIGQTWLTHYFEFCSVTNASKFPHAVSLFQMVDDDRITHRPVVVSHSGLLSPELVTLINRFLRCFSILLKCQTWQEVNTKGRKACDSVKAKIGSVLYISLGKGWPPEHSAQRVQCSPSDNLLAFF